MIRFRTLLAVSTLLCSLAQAETLLGVVVAGRKRGRVRLLTVYAYTTDLGFF
jgi:hypothetical protein